MSSSCRRACRNAPRGGGGGDRASSSSSGRRALAFFELLLLVVAFAAAAAAATLPESSSATAVLEGRAEQEASAEPPKAAAQGETEKNNRSTTTSTPSRSSASSSSSSSSRPKGDEILDVTVNADGSTTTTVRLAPTTGQREAAAAANGKKKKSSRRAEDEHDDDDDDDEGDFYDDEEDEDEDETYEEDYDSQEGDEDDEEVEPDGPTFDECTRPLAEGTEPRSLDDVKVCYGVEQSTDEYDESLLLQVDNYMRNVVAIEPKYESVRRHCRNVNAFCTYWASIGECDANKAFMLTNCGPACRSCDKFIYEERCPVDPRLHETNAWRAGDLNTFFERVVTHPYYQKFQPNVLCKPGMFNEHSQKDCPWVVTLDNFLTDHECETLIQQGSVEGYERSEDVGERKPDGSYGSVKSSGRTSTNAWCSDNCLKNETVQGVIAKLENLTGIPDANNEFLQLLRYDVGQFYQSHHDYIDHDVDRATGPRILTVFLYLNDVEEGGATHFTDLDMAVYPKRGRVLLWPSVLDADPSHIDRRTHHQAQPVVKGVKYGANSWVHLRDFKTPYAAGCT